MIDTFHHFQDKQGIIIVKRESLLFCMTLYLLCHNVKLYRRSLPTFQYNTWSHVSPNQQASGREEGDPCKPVTLEETNIGEYSKWKFDS